MAGRQKYDCRALARKGRLWENRYVRIIGSLVIIVMVASFYIYQRVWVRNLVSEIQELRDQNELAAQRLAELRTEWTEASSIASLETRIEAMGLGLQPTKPSQNLALSPPSRMSGRYAGLLTALEKLGSNLPLVTSNEAEADQLFEQE